MSRAPAILYSLICYAIGVATLVYLILFIGDLFVPYSVNSASPLAPALTGPLAVLFDVALVALWGAQHTFMASKPFKRWWTKYVPASIERSTYLLFVTAMTAILVLFWVPVGGSLWSVGGIAGAALLVLFFSGWLLTLFATFLINHFHLFGLQQAWQGETEVENKQTSFVTPVLYKLVRHPMMSGMLISFWSVPEMTVSRLVLNIAFSIYILVGIYYEEKTLVDDLGDEYLAYRKSTASLVPGVI